MSGAIAMGTSKITGLGTPTNAADAATKAYVDSVAQGIDWKASVRVAKTTQQNSGPTLVIIDGITLNEGDRFLLTGQTDPTENGIYVKDGFSLVRAADADTGTELTSSLAVFVEQGTVNADQGYVLTNDGAITSRNYRTYIYSIYWSRTNSCWNRIRQDWKHS
jgi:phage-related tail fiber protein